MRIDPHSEILDLTGEWRVVHHVEASERADFVGLSIEFQITLLQSGGQLAGGGEKFLVDRQPARPGEISQLEITGWVDRSEVQVSLMEVSARGDGRMIMGEIVWEVADPDRLVGSFRVDLAHTRGRSEAFRRAS